MRNIDKQQIIIIIVAVITIGGFGVLRYLPLAGKTRAIKSARAQFQDGDLEVKNQARQIPLLNAKMEQIRSRIGDYDKKVPFGREFASLYDEITDVMKKHNLSDQFIQPGSEIIGNEMSAIPISIECSGNLNDIFGLFKSIESLNRLIRIESLDMVSKVDQDVIAVKAGAVVFFRNENGLDRGNKI